jgi:ABC-type transport system involved in multi-copper enzyme maturation permease subunit
MSAESTAVLPPPLAAKFPGDFPTWLPAMFVKELRQGMRTRGFVVVFIMFQALMALLMMGAVVGQDTAVPGARASIATAISGFFWTLLAVQLLFVTPARALGSLQTEMESRSLDLLLLTRLSAWRIVVGKWASLVAQAALLLVAMLPYGIVRYFAGSVDLVSDAGLCLGMLGTCAVFTAAGLWSSGLSKILRVVFVIAGIFVGQIWRPLLAGFGVGTAGPSLALTWVQITMWSFDGALLLVFFLVAAVRRIAPLAENHSPLARALPVVALLAMPAWAHWATLDGLRAEGAFTAGFILLVCAMEFANSRWPMAVHVRPWQLRGGWGRFVGRFVLPGWPSALLFASLVTGMTAIAVQFSTPLPPPSHKIAVGWLVTLALGALTFPALALAYFPRTARRSSASLYGLSLGAMSVLAVTVAVLAAAFPAKYAQLVLYARVLPVTGFWLSLPDPDGLSTKAMIVQAVLFAAVMAAAWWQSQKYWQHVAAIEARERGEKS